MSWAKIKTLSDVLQGGREEFLSDGTFIVPSLVTRIYITACGGGGGGGSGGGHQKVAVTSSRGGGGGGGSGGGICL